MLLFHLRERHAKRTCVEAHHIDGLLDRDGIDFAEEVLAEVESIFLDLSSALDIALEHLVTHVVDSAGSDVGDDGDNTESAHGHKRNDLVV